MATEASKQSKGKAEAEVFRGESVAALLGEIQDSIAVRAYHLYEARGSGHGHDTEDWIRAESELIDNAAAGVQESPDHLRVDAYSPGFRIEEIKVGIEPSRVIIWARKYDGAESVQSERNEILRIVNLPYEIDAARASVKSAKGRLDVELPRSQSNA